MVLPIRGEGTLVRVRLCSRGLSPGDRNLKASATGRPLSDRIAARGVARAGRHNRGVNGARRGGLTFRVGVLRPMRGDRILARVHLGSRGSSLLRPGGRNLRSSAAGRTPGGRILVSRGMRRRGPGGRMLRLSAAGWPPALESGAGRRSQGARRTSRRRLGGRMLRLIATGWHPGDPISASGAGRQNQGLVRRTNGLPLDSRARRGTVVRRPLGDRTLACGMPQARPCSGGHVSRASRAPPESRSITGSVARPRPVSRTLVGRKIRWCPGRRILVCSKIGLRSGSRTLVCSVIGLRPGRRILVCSLGLRSVSRTLVCGEIRPRPDSRIPACSVIRSRPGRMILLRVVVRGRAARPCPVGEMVAGGPMTPPAGRPCPSGGWNRGERRRSSTTW